MIGTGLINGGTNYSNQMQGDLVKTTPAIDAGDTFPVVVPTVLQMSRDALAYWQNITCFFNKWWFPERDRVTLPFCFFHTVKYSEKHSLDASQKRVILYEPPEEDAEPGKGRADPVRQGLMQTITDNIVIKPKEYLLEAIVPFMPFGRYAAQNDWVLNNVVKTFTDAGSGISSSARLFIDAQVKAGSGLGGAASAAKRIMDAVGNEHMDIGPNTMVNKNSLDAMFERGNILEFKTWMGYDKKYVVIVEKTLEKRGIEDDVWRVQMTLREMPVLSLTRAADTVQPILQPWAREATDAVGAVVAKRNAQMFVPALEAMEE